MIPDKKEHERRRDALYKVLTKFGLPSENSTWVSSSVHQMVKTVLAGDARDVRAIRRGPERKKLLEVRAAAKTLAKKMRALNPRVLYKIEGACCTVAAAGPPRMRGGHIAGRMVTEVYENPVLDGDFWQSFWDTVCRLDHVIDQIAPEVNRQIDAAPDAGRRDLVGVEVVDRLRMIWEEALDKGAAPLNITETGEFSDFLADAFEALGLKANPRAAVDSWREYVTQTGNEDASGWYD
jgi:hypothetical protein